MISVRSLNKICMWILFLLYSLRKSRLDSFREWRQSQILLKIQIETLIKDKKYLSKPIRKECTSTQTNFLTLWNLYILINFSLNWHRRKLKSIDLFTIIPSNRTCSPLGHSIKERHRWTKVFIKDKLISARTNKEKAHNGLA